MADKKSKKSDLAWYRRPRTLMIAGGCILIGVIGIGITKSVNDARGPVTIKENTQEQSDPEKGGSGGGSKEVAMASDVWNGYGDYPGTYTAIDYPDNEFGVKAYNAGQAEYDAMMDVFNPNGTKEKPYPVLITANYGSFDVTVSTVSVDGSSTVIYFDIKLWDTSAPYAKDFQLIYEDGSTGMLSAAKDLDIVANTNEEGENDKYSFTYNVEGKKPVTLKIIGEGIDPKKGYHDLVHYYSGSHFKGGPNWNEWVAKKYTTFLKEAGISEEEAKKLPKIDGSKGSEKDDTITIG